MRTLRGDAITSSPQGVNTIPLPDIPQGNDDASLYSFIQLHYLSQYYQTFFYGSLDFSRVDDDSIYKMISKGSFVAKYVFDNEIPLSSKRSASYLKDFFNLGTQQQKMKFKQDGRTRVYRYRKPIAGTCFGMDMYSVLRGIRTDENCKLSTIGYESLVRMAMLNRIKSLNDNDLNKNILNQNTDGFVTIESSCGKKEKTWYLRRIGSFIYASDQFSFSVQHRCSAMIEEDATMCADCKSALKDIKVKCRKRGNFKASELHVKTNNKVVLMSPTDVETKMKRIQKDLKQVRDKSRLRKKKRMVNDIFKHGIHGDEQIYELFGEDFVEKAKEWLTSKESISKDHIAELLLHECLQARKQAKLKGKTNVRYSPLMIRFAVFLKKKIGMPAYKFMQKMLNLPSVRTIGDYETPDTNSKDGPLYESIKELSRQMREQADKAPNGSKLEEFKMTGSLAFDSTYVKEGLHLNKHSLQIVGWENDAFDEDVLLKEFQALEDAANIEDVPIVNGGALSSDLTADILLEPEIPHQPQIPAPVPTKPAPKPKKPAPKPPTDRPANSKQYLIFMFSTWEQNSRRIKMCVARFCVGSSLQAIYLYRKIIEIISVLYMHGIIVNNITGDGASENRSAFKMLGTKSAMEMFGEEYNHVTEGKKKQKVAFIHPCDATKYVFIGGELPHWVKKLVNSFENSGFTNHKRSLIKGGFAMSLKLIQEIWERDRMTSNTIRTTKLTIEHFEKNPWSRMRVFLAMQICSASVVKLIDEVGVQIYAQDTLKPMRDLLEKVDRMIDIWNVKKTAAFIDHPKHEHIKELYEVLAVFTEWSKESQDPYNFVSYQMYEDLAWIVYGIHGIAKYYLCDDKTCTMHQGRSGSDVCEHEFARAKDGNPNPTCAQISDATSAGNGYRLTGDAFKMESKTNSTRKTAYLSELNAPIERNNQY